MRNYNRKYLGYLTDTLEDGQVFVLSSWKAKNNWLTKQVCKGWDSCDSNPTATISNLKITTNASQTSK